MFKLNAQAIGGILITGISVSANAESSNDDIVDGTVVRESKLETKPSFKADTTVAQVLKDHVDDVLVCYGAVGSPARWNAAIASGAELLTKFASMQSPDDAPSVKDKQSVLDKANAALGGATLAAKDAAIRLSEASNSDAEWSKRTDPAATQDKIKAKNELDAAKRAKDAADLLVVSTTEAITKAQADLQAARKVVLEGREEETASARNLFAATLARVENDSRSPANFREAVRDKARRDACRRYTTAVNNAFKQSATPVKAAQALATEKSTDKAADLARVTARIDDTIDKTNGLQSAIVGASNVIEQAGAPERVVYTVMSALGADSKTTGAQLLMTLNLSSVGSTDSTKPVNNTLLRNLFLRVGLPLQKTDNQTQAAAASTTTTVTDVSRMSLVLGGSLIDESDPRLATHDECFDFVKAYIPLSLDATESAARVSERQLYYGSCAQIAANSARLAWRAGLGLTTTRTNDHQDTKPELIAGALVYGPADWVLFNVIGQRLLQPYFVNTVGGGFSLRVDAGGDKPGSQWGRASIDAIGLAQIRESDPSSGIRRSTAWEARISATASGKIATGGVAQFSLGPRILSSGDVGLFSTIGLTYDADNLINTLLVPPPTQQ